MASRRRGPPGARTISISPNPATDRSEARTPRTGQLLLLIFGVGFQLRSVILGLPPLLPAVRAELHLPFVAVGTLSALPLLCMALAAVPGALLVHRIGARLVIGLGTLVLGMAGILRIAPPEPLTLFAFTTVMTLGVAVAQPAMAAYVRVHFPGALQRAAGVYTTALTMGGLAASLGVPLLVLGGWRAGLVVWSLPAIVLALLWLYAAPASSAERGGEPGTIAAIARSRAAWHVAVIFGVQSLIYYTVATWVPFRLHGVPPAYLSLVLLALTSAGIPTGLILSRLERPWATSRLLYAGAGVLIALADVCFLAGYTPLAWLCASLLNAGVTCVFTGANALPTILARDPRQVAGFAALMLTAGYLISVLGPQISGLLVDRTHDFASPFWLVLVAALALVPLGLTLPVSRAASARRDGSFR